jgi:RNA polymerase sigma factor (sigma-70 family)
MNGARPKLTDEELALALKQGDETAFRDLFERHSRAIVARLCRRLLPAADAEDLAQEVWLRVFERIKFFEPGRGTFRTWLFTLTRDIAVDAVRRQATSTQPGTDDGITDSIAWGPPPQRACRRFARAIVQGLESRVVILLTGIVRRIENCAPSGFLPQHASWFVHRCDHPPKEMTGFFSPISFRDGVFQTSH